MLRARTYKYPQRHAVPVSYTSPSALRPPSAAPPLTTHRLSAATTPATMTRTLRAARVDRAHYAPASEAEDLSRMLDPAYTKRSASTSPRTRLPALPPTVYVDHAGDMHDPDFRAFPVLPSPPPRHAAHPPLSPPAAASDRRPSWDALFDVHPVTPPAAPAVHEHDHLRCFFKRRSPPGSRRPSFEEEYVYDEDDEDEDSSFPHTPESGSTQQHIELSGKEALKYQVQALSLSVQLGVFRAKRRWRERKHSHSHQPT